jgi:ATPase subunit of ABC transporter with duplicated ATPase domains
VFDRGHGIPYEGNYTSWLEQKQKRLEQEEKQEKARQRTLASELEWIRQSPRARQDKSKARISAYETLLAEAKEKSPDTAQINVPIGPRLGNLVIEAKGLRKGFEEKLLIDHLSFKLPPGGIVGVIGANGTGKTTLFRMIAGQDTPDNGSISLGDTVSLGYVDQSRAELHPDKTVWEEISEGLDEVELGYRTMQSRAYVSQFNFQG